jgi:hypothetical protein
MPDRPMKWRWGLLGVWLVFGFPALIMAATAHGGFDPLPAPLPLLRGDRSDTSLVANVGWLSAVLIVYGPIVILSASALWRWVRRFVAADRSEN